MKRTPRTLNEILERNAADTPERIIYRFLTFSNTNEMHETAITCNELAQQVQAVAAFLQQRDAAGERALLLFPPGLEYIQSYLGCLYADVIAVPVYVPLSVSQLGPLKYIADNCQARFVLSIGPIIDIVKSLGNFTELFGHMEFIATDQLPENIKDSYRPVNIKSDNLAFLQYTSGSTSRPKGVMVTHQNLLHNIYLISKYFHIDQTLHEVSWLPPYHDMGLIGGILTPFYLNACSTLMSPLDFLQKPLRWFQAITRYKATTSGGPNFAYDLCVKKITAEQVATLDLRSWTLAFNGAETIRTTTLDDFTHKFAPCGFKQEVFYPCYGMAEATLMITGGHPKQLPVKESLDTHRLKSGEAVSPQNGCAPTTLIGSGTNLETQEIRIVNPNSLETCPECTVGEIWVAGPSVAQGYWNQPENINVGTFRAMTAEGCGPYLRTGDLGFVKNDELFVTGRLKDMIIIRGQNYYPHDIEHTMASVHPACRPGCGTAFAVEIEGTEGVVAVQEINKAHADTTDLAKLSQDIKKRVSERHGISLYKLVLIPHGTIPKTSSGKLRRSDSKAAFLSGSLVELKLPASTLSAGSEENIEAAHQMNSPAPVPKREAVEIQEWVVLHLAEKLKVTATEIDIHAPFRHFAPSSLDVMHLADELEEWLGKRVPHTLLFNHPTIALLAKALADEKTATATVAATAQQNKNRRQTEVRDRDIAIIGIGCRFPGGANSPDQFWEILENGIDTIQKLPEDRRFGDTPCDNVEADRLRNGISYGGYIDDVDKFDAAFFSMLPREAEATDPQQRLLLETSWHALEHAGIRPSQLSNSRTGVFIGISSSDYAHLYGKKLLNANVYSGIGNSQSIAANRISYFYNLRGPSIAIDTACSSSLVAVHTACTSLYSGETNLALAGGVNLLLNQDLSLLLARGGMLAMDGKCKSFDKSANGYVRGEGCGVVVLKRLADALQDGDNVIAVIAGSAVNQDGRSNGITAPNGPAQEELIMHALGQAAISPEQIGYVEAHGTGTSLGDPIEVNTLIKILSPGRTSKDICYLGSVKTNIGHLEAAAGIAGLIKTALCLKNKKIPPNLHLKQINPRIDIDHAPIAFPTKARDFRGPAENAYAGVNSFGFGGSNAHVILKSWRSDPLPAKHGSACGTSPKGRPVLITLSAHNEERLYTVAASLRDFVQEALLNTRPEVAPFDIVDLAYSLHFSREALLERVAFVVADVPELILRLDNFCRNIESSENTFRGNARRDRKHMELITSGDSGKNHLKAIIANRELEKLAHFWTCGFNPDWRFLYEGMQPQKIQLPGYPFERQHHWVNNDAKKTFFEPDKQLVNLRSPTLVPIRTCQ